MQDTAGSLPSSSRYAHPLISFTGSNLVFHINYCSFIEWKTCIFNYDSWNVGWLWNQVLGIGPFEPRESAVLFYSFSLFFISAFQTVILAQQKPGRERLKAPSSGQEFSVERRGKKALVFTWFYAPWNTALDFVSLSCHVVVNSCLLQSHYFICRPVKH